MLDQDFVDRLKVSVRKKGASWKVASLVMQRGPEAAR